MIFEVPLEHLPQDISRRTMSVIRPTVNYYSRPIVHSIKTNTFAAAILRRRNSSSACGGGASSIIARPIVSLSIAAMTFAHQSGVFRQFAQKIADRWNAGGYSRITTNRLGNYLLRNYRK